MMERDPDSDATAQTELGYIAAVLQDINRNLIAIEAAILGADTPEYPLDLRPDNRPFPRTFGARDEQTT